MKIMYVFLQSQEKNFLPIRGKEGISKSQIREQYETDTIKMNHILRFYLK